MKKEFKFNIGDTVFFLNKTIQTSRVIKVYFKMEKNADGNDITEGIKYVLDYAPSKRFKEEELFKSKEQLLKSL